MKAGFNKAASPYLFPDWAIRVLASPDDNQPLDYDGTAFRSYGGTAIEYRIENHIAVLALEEEALLASFRDQFPTYSGSQYQMLNPTQVRFRYLLKAFWAQIPPDAIAVDIASGECEFFHYHPHVHCIPMDISAARLERAVQLQRTNFGVVANIRRPPLQEHSVDVIVSSNTLNHLPSGDVPGIVRNLLRFLVPGGLLGVTLQVDTLAPVSEALPEQTRIISTKAIDGPLSRFWNSRRHWIIKSAMQRLPHPVANGGRVAAGVAAATVAGLDRLITSYFNHAPTHFWMTIQRENDV